MRTSGNGAHRRPRQAPKFVVAVGATGAGIALPLLTSAGTAHAATASTWDRVAACETGGDWTAAADGFAGGLSLTQTSWLEYGGTAYADRPDLATPDQQIAVAQKILAADGPRYWGDCAITAGLTQTAGGDAGGSDPVGGVLGGLLGGAPSVAAPTPDATASPTPTATASASPAPTTSPSSANPLASQGDSGGTPHSPSGGRHARPSAPDVGGVGGASGVGGTTGGRHGGAGSGGSGGGASGVGGAGGIGAGGGGVHARPGSGGLDGAGGDGSGDGGAYTVRPGDNLYEIATKHDVPGGWPALYHANHVIVGADPELIRPGQVLALD